MPETCNPKPPTACGAPSSRAFLRRLHLSSCSIPPRATPKRETCNPELLAIKHESLPPLPIMVGAIAVGTGLDSLPGAPEL